MLVAEFRLTTEPALSGADGHHGIQRHAFGWRSASGAAIQALIPPGFSLRAIYFARKGEYHAEEFSASKI
jgi:hypothetical protein